MPAHNYTILHVLFARNGLYNPCVIQDAFSAKVLEGPTECRLKHDHFDTSSINLSNSYGAVNDELFPLLYHIGFFEKLCSK
jgi:hypothetical protein